MKVSCHLPSANVAAAIILFNNIEFVSGCAIINYILRFHIKAWEKKETFRPPPTHFLLVVVEWHVCYLHAVVVILNCQAAAAAA